MHLGDRLGTYQIDAMARCPRTLKDVDLTLPMLERDDQILRRWVEILIERCEGGKTCSYSAMVGLRELSTLVSATR